MASILRANLNVGGPRRALLLLGSSLAAIAVGYIAPPVQAQGTLHLNPVSVRPLTPPAASSGGALVRPLSMRAAVARQVNSQLRIDQIRSTVTAARDAAIAATRAQPTDGLSTNGLDPIAAVREAIAATNAGDTTKANQLLVSVSAANDATGKNTWAGAALPSQTTVDGKILVSIDQTESRALLSWNRFDIGANTTLQFNQKQAGVAQPGWSVVNRVVDAIAPSTILGSMKADGTVVVLNSHGVVFGQNSQVNLHSLLVSTLEIGNSAKKIGSQYIGASLNERNTAYLQNGLFGAATNLVDSTGTVPVSYLLAPTLDAGVVIDIQSPPAAIEGTVSVDAGANITAGNGGFIILAGPRVESAGTLNATNGQVSLQGGRYITASLSTGANDSVDPDVRGYLLRTYQAGRTNAGLNLSPTADDGVVVNTGAINSTRGYISLGASLYGSVTNGGLLSATTSVSRNGKIALNAGTVNLLGSSDPAHASGIAILADNNGEVIPQGTANEPAAFKSSKIEIGALSFPAASNASVIDLAGTLTPGVVNMGRNAIIYAPNADVTMGRKANAAVDYLSALNSSIDIDEGAILDVSGLKDVQLSADRNTLAITPVKRNELRDTPNYREVAIGDDFSLNGTTLYLDPRLSGVRSDGVRWIGSPLIEAGSILGQIPVSAAELMTRGGNITLNVGPLLDTTPLQAAPHIRIAQSAVLDFSGGWVNYAAGLVRSSRLLTADGRRVDIGSANPNDIYVGVDNGFTAAQPGFGISDTYNSGLLSNTHFEASYDEGRDAGSLIIGGPALGIDGTLFGNAFAGSRQKFSALAPTAASKLANDPRKMQASPLQLPSGGLLRIGSFGEGKTADLGADIVIYHGTRGVEASSYAQTLLNDQMLNDAGLSALKLQTSGSIILAGAEQALLQPDGAYIQTGVSDLKLANGGTLALDAGRNIRFDGTVSVPAGTVNANAYFAGNTRVATSSAGSAFRTDDDRPTSIAIGEITPESFNISVTGTISTAGRFVNDSLATEGLEGKAWTNGGSINLHVSAPDPVAVVDAQGAIVDYAANGSSIIIAPTALLDVSAGAYVSPTRKLDLSASGGNISFLNDTIYAPIGASGVQSDLFTNFVFGQMFVPSQPTAKVVFDEHSLKGFGFSGGGTFTLFSPNISFGSDTATDSSHLSLDFFRNTGFGTLNATSYQSLVAPHFFRNGNTPNAVFLKTTQFTIHSGEQLDLTQTLLPSILDVDQTAQILALGNGAIIRDVLTPSVPTDLWDQKAANLVLGGLTELDVEQGGKIIGAPQASLTVSKLYNAGEIVLHGGSIRQIAALPAIVANRGFGIANDAGGLSSVFGEADANGQRDANAPNSAGHIIQPNLPVPYTNEQLAGTGAVYFLGTLGVDEGIRLTDGSVTDLSGIAITNPRATVFANGQRLVTGRLLDGGTISTASAFVDTKAFDSGFFRPLVFQNPQDLTNVTDGLAMNALAGATINLDGTRASFDVLTAPGRYSRMDQWSNGGRLSVLASGTLAGANISAHGGAIPATGGTLEWLNPTISARYLGDDSSNRLFVDQIESAGFDSLIARGGVTFDGNLTLDLRKSFLVTAAPLASNVAVRGRESQVIVSAIGADGNSESVPSNATVNAGYIRFGSASGRINDADVQGQLANTGSASLTLNAGSLGMDFVGATMFDDSIGATRLTSLGDIRLTGVNNSLKGELPLLNGELLAQGDLSFDAARVYATTGTGNLQQILENQRAGSLSKDTLPFEIMAFGNSTIRFDGSHINAATPLSAGSYLRVQAANIEQNGYLAAPLGLLEIGGTGQSSVAGQTELRGIYNASPVPIDLFPNGIPRSIATQSVTFGAGSITTVSGVGVNIPYGTTTDLNEYFFSPTTVAPLNTTPTGQLTIAGGSIDITSGAKVDGRGGGAVFGFEFVSGIGGSRDVLDRINRDQFSSNSYDPVTGIGYQYADKRQVFAILPADQAKAVALFDPIYSADYGAAGPVNLYGAQVGMTVHLDAAPGIAAGDYVLLPAHYALLPGALRIVENTGSAAPAFGQNLVQLDGSVIVGGNYATAGTDLSESTRRSFTLASQDVFKKSSQIVTTDGTSTVVKQADVAGKTTPAVPLDAARVVLSPLTSLKVAGLFDFTPATGGNGAKVDISGTHIVLGADDTAQTEGALTLTNTTLANLHANSLFIGGRRTENSNGTTTLGVTAQDITINGDTRVTAPELLFAVGARNASAVVDQPVLRVQDGAVLTATGTLDDASTGDYVIASQEQPAAGNPYALTGVGVALRVANTTERLFSREGDYAARTTLQPATLSIGAATISGGNIALDSSRNFAISDFATLTAPHIALSGDVVRLADVGIRPAIEAKLAAADRLTLRSPDAIGFSNGVHTFNHLVIDAPAIARVAVGADHYFDQADVTISADTVEWHNSAKDFAGCFGVATKGCGAEGSSLAINANEIAFGSGKLGVYGFNVKSAVSLNALKGIYIEGKGGLSVANETGSLATSDSSLTIVAPFVADRGLVANPQDQKVRPDFTFTTGSTFTLSAPTLAEGATQAIPTGNRAPGARIAIGTADKPVTSVSIDGAKMLATAGTIDIRSATDITLSGGAMLSAPGYSKTFGDAVDSTTVSAGGGTITLIALNGNIVLPSTSTLIVDSFDGPDAKGKLDANDGRAGALNLFASRGSILFDAAINPGVIGQRNASLAFDAQTSPFDLSAFVTKYGTQFGGDLDIRSGTGDLALGVGQTIKANSVKLTADGGVLSVAGTIDTSGTDVSGMAAALAKDARVDGGAIALYGKNGLALAATARLDAHTTGYLDSDTRVAKAGDVTLGIGAQSANLSIANGATIDVSARRTLTAQAKGLSGNRLIAQTVKDPVSLTDVTVYRFAEADMGGTVTFRAPVDDATGSKVDIRLPGASPIVGADTIQIEGFRRYDLDALGASGLYSGVADLGDGAIHLNFAETEELTGYSNFLTEDFTADHIGEGGADSMVHFIRNFSVSAVDGSSFAGFRQRPGVELVSTKSIQLDSNWNLGAGTVDRVVRDGQTISDYDRALRDGVLVPIDALNFGFTGDGDKYVAVAPGQDANLFENYTTMLYRVGGKASGEAPIVTLRAARDLNSGFSISDGFFLFRDRTDPYYMSYQLGGGNRAILPAATFTCGTPDNADCGSVPSFVDYLAQLRRPDPDNPFDLSTIAKLNVASLVGGDDVSPAIPAPFSTRGNSAAALGALDDFGLESGDALGAADLFPLLNGGQDFAKSSDIRLVGGAGADLSANPLHVDRATRGDVKITGEHSYAINGVRGQNSFAVDPVTGKPVLQIRITPVPGAGSPYYLSLLANRGFVSAAANSDLANSFAGVNGNLAVDQSENAFTFLSWGTAHSPAADYLREQALTYFKIIDPDTARLPNYTGRTIEQLDRLKIGILQGRADAPSGVAARLNDVTGFLASIDKSNGLSVGANLAQMALDQAYPVAIPRSTAPISMGAGKTAYYGSLVRTGDGAIDIAAARNVDLLRTENVVYRVQPNAELSNDQNKYQVGGSAVYTAGHRLLEKAITAATADGLTQINFAWNSAPTATNIAESAYLPSAKSQFFNLPALLTGGGSIDIYAGGDVLGRRDILAEMTRGEPVNFQQGTIGDPFTKFAGNTFQNLTLAEQDWIGADNQLWRVGAIGQNTNIAIVPQYFSSGIGTLGGGDIRIDAGGNVSGLTIALDTSAITANPRGTPNTDPQRSFASVAAFTSADNSVSAPVLMSFGGGNLALNAGADLIGGQIDVASGYGDITLGGSVTPSDSVVPSTIANQIPPQPDYLRLRVSDAAIALIAKGSVDMTGINALGAGSGQDNAYNSAGNFSAIAGADLVATGSIRFAGDQQSAGIDRSLAIKNGFVLPPSLALASLMDDIVLTDATKAAQSQVVAPYMLYPSAVGQLSLLAGGAIKSVALAMLDSDPSLLPGPFSAAVTRLDSSALVVPIQGLGFTFPGVTPYTNDATRRLYHNQKITHANDLIPARIYAGGSISNATFSLAKQARLGAGLDLVNVFFVGQNINPSDITRVTAGRDITSTSGFVGLQQFFVGNSFTLGGPGILDIEAGRNLGPFLTSATISEKNPITQIVSETGYAGGIRTIGNDYNPWLPSQGASIMTLFGVGKGVDYGALRETYLNPANFANLDGDLFAQVVDENGNAHPDRSRYVYAPMLAKWLRDNQPQAFADAFGDATFADDAALEAAAYQKTDALYAAFSGLSQVQQNGFLVNSLYFNELAAPSQPDGPSFQQYIRGYRAVQTLFPTSLGYTDNLAAYETDPSTINADHPLGVPRRKTVDGQPVVANRVETGNVDLRLSTIQTTRGGDISILGPGGNFLAGSVVRTSDQAARRGTRFGTDGLENSRVEYGNLAPSVRSFTGVPAGFEGVLTLRGGAIRGFTDGDFKLNQSRLFTMAGGDITLWSSNGDLNAGQGPKSAASFPPITERFSPDGLKEVDSAGSVSGAGIGAFKQQPDDPNASIILVAPVGEVDAGDAGVRATGNVFVAAARVANADNFKAGGSISGVPAVGAVAAPVAPNAASAVTAAAARIGSNADAGDRKSIITVDVLGYAGDDKCAAPNSADPACATQ